MKKSIAVIFMLFILAGCDEPMLPDSTVPIVENIASNSEIQPAQKQTPVEEQIQPGAQIQPAASSNPAPEEDESPDNGDDVSLDGGIEKIDADVDLSSFPELFLGELGGKTVANTIIVVGRKAPAKDVISATIIAGTLNELVEKEDNRAMTVLDDEVSSVLDRNAIVIGNPCDNPKAKELMKISDCNADLENKKAMIKLYENNGFVQMLIVGYDADGTYKAAQKLVDSALEGKFIVMGYS
ncbi:hypothetical protein HY638_04035 [Candidatus Woesearchaeota archaeon]|nr:hypothetical protein [Candidatus Woesearchaeota archaeon]